MIADTAPARGALAVPPWRRLGLGNIANVGDLAFWAALLSLTFTLFLVDDRVFALVRVERHSMGDEAARMLQWFGKFWPLFWFVLIPAVVFGRQRLTLRTLAGLFVVLAVVHAMKATVGRARPYPTGFDSFPSGHAAAAFFVAALWSLQWPRVKFWLYGGCVALCLGRVLLGRHYPSDVVMGCLIGHVVGHFAAMDWTKALAVTSRGGTRADRFFARLWGVGSRRLQFLPHLAMLLTILWPLFFAENGLGRLTRVFGPALLLLWVWGCLHQRFDIEKWLRREFTGACGTS